MRRMRVPGRYWWLDVLMGCILGLATVFVTWLGLSIVQLDQQLGNSTAQDYVFVSLMAVLILFAAALLVRLGVRDRRHYRQRRTALEGNLGAIPPADVPQVEALPDLAAGQYVLTWRATGIMRFILLPLVILYALAVSAGVAFMLATSAQAPLLAVLQAFEGGAPPSVGDIVMDALMLAMLMLIVIAGIVFARALPTLLGRPYGVWISGQGIESRSQLGRRAFVRWSEIRLFEIEVRGQSGSVRQTYRVYGQYNIATWDR